MPPGPHRNRPAGWARCTRPCTSACSAARRTGLLSERSCGHDVACSSTLVAEPGACNFVFTCAFEPNTPRGMPGLRGARGRGAGGALVVAAKLSKEFQTLRRAGLV